MSGPRRTRLQYGPLSWLAGLLVLGGLAWTLATLVRGSRSGLVTASIPEAVGPTADGAGPAAPTQQAAGPVARTLAGAVRRPDGEPAFGATVEVRRALTEGPEWRHEMIAQAITGADGTFVFALPQRHGLLLEFWHPDYAGDFREVPARCDRLQLDLRPGFELGGIVTGDSGLPLASVRVAAESTIDQLRRVEVTTTSPSGGYRFTNLVGGTVRLVARHARYQAVAATVRVGETTRHDIRFSVASSAPLGGRVVTPGQVPIAGAVVELLPTNGRLGLVDPIIARTDSAGRFLLVGLARGPMSLRVRHPEHGVLRRTISVGATPAEPLLELPPRSAVGGTLEAEPGSDLAVAGVLVRAVDAAGEIHFATTDDDGAFAFARKLSPGRASLALPDAEMAFARSQSFESSVYIEEEKLTNLALKVVAPSVVRGHCVDDAGQPLAGVAVYGSAQLTAAKLIGSNLASYIGAVGQEVALTLGGGRDLLLAVTAADGSYEFKAQEPGPLLVRYEHEGRATRRARVNVPPPGAPVELEQVVLPRGCCIEGTVRRGARPLAGVVVLVTGDEYQMEALTREGGRFTVEDLMPGEYRVRARFPTPVGTEEQIVRVAADEAVPVVRLELPPGRVIEGVVVTGRGRRPVENALVAVRGAEGQPTLTEPDGSFSLEIPSRATQLQVSLAGDSEVTTVTVMPRQREVTIELDAPPTCRLVAEVAGLPGRKRVPAVMLRLQCREPGGPGGERTRWVEVQNGELRWSHCPVGMCRIEIRCEGYVPHVVELKLVAQEEHHLGVILLEPGGKVRGRVLDGERRPVANARVFLGTEADLDVFEASVRSDSTGGFEVSGVSTRSATLVVHAPGFAPAVRQLRLPADVLGGAPIEVAVQPGSILAVQVADAPESRLVQLLRGGKLLASAVLDDMGRVEFLDRGPGEYEVRLYGSSGRASVARITAPGQTVRVVIE